jgi:RNA polymerase sigma-70 factor (ECF subfamily)
MPPTQFPATVNLAPEASRRLYERADAARWGLREDDLRPALERSLRHRFPSSSSSAPPSSSDIETYLESLHVADLALACACALGRDAAWEHFVREFRSVLLRVAGRNAPLDAARDVADSIYAELYGLEERDGVRRSIFDYYHGRSALVSWLRAVVAQRVVDRAREGKRLDPLPEAGDAGEPIAKAPPPDVDRGRLLPAVRAVFKAAIAALDPRDRMRLSLYYTQDLTLAAIGRTIGESEATASRKLERTRRDLRAAVERRLRNDNGMTEREVRESFDYARTDPAFDLARALPPD